jgi:hypothetical protein|tara:strand:- start:178 stop:390 length:213 start_codon:yes stop_codon:yes gene_type:complete
MDHTIIMDYKPYSPEWHRLRYLKEAIDRYFDDYAPTEIILEDIDTILSARSETALDEYTRVTDLQKKLRD